jgi:hypothetical protein
MEQKCQIGLVGRFEIAALPILRIKIYKVFGSLLTPQCPDWAYFREG